MPDTAASPPLGESPAYLIAAAYSAHRSGDRELERVTRRRLDREYGIRLTFRRSISAAPTAVNQQEVARG